MEITRTYRIYTLTLDNNKKIMYNLDNNEVIGVSGKPIKNPPTYVDDSLTNLLYNLTKEKMNNGKDWEEIVNRIISYEVNYEIKNILIRSLMYSDMEWVLKNWKKVLKGMLEMIKDKCYLWRLMNSYDDIKIILTNYELMKKYADIFVNDKVKNYFCKSIYTNFFTEKTFRDIIKKEIKKEKKFFENQNKVKEYLGTEDLNIIYRTYGIKFQDFDLYHHIDEITKKYARIKSLLNRMSMNNYKITDIYTDYNYIVSLYEKNKIENDNRYFKANQTEKNLFFENDEYKIYIPTSREELREIGNTFNNCANGHEWNVYLSGNYRKLVVVIDKKTEKYKVCCDISSYDGEICQYLIKNNRSVQSATLNNFKNEYQDYLTKIWKEVE